MVGISKSMVDWDSSMGNTDVLDGGDGIGSWDGVWDSNWVGNVVWCWYIIWFRDVLGDNGGDFLGLVDWLGDSDIIGFLNDVQLRDNFSDLGSV